MLRRLARAATWSLIWHNFEISRQYDRIFKQFFFTKYGNVICHGLCLCSSNTLETFNPLLVLKISSLKKLYNYEFLNFN